MFGNEFKLKSIWFWNRFMSPPHFDLSFHSNLGLPLFIIDDVAKVVTHMRKQEAHRRMSHRSMIEWHWVTKTYMSAWNCVTLKFTNKKKRLSLISTTFLPRDARSASAVLLSYVVRPSLCPSVCLSVTLMYYGQVGSTSSKLITGIISLGSSLLKATTSDT